MDAIWKNAQHGIRVLRQKGSTTLIMILSIALGIGATTAFSASLMES